MFLRVVACLVLSLVVFSVASPTHRVRVAQADIAVAVHVAEAASAKAEARTCARGWPGAGLAHGGGGQCLHAVTLPKGDAAFGPRPDSRRVAWVESHALLTQRHIAPSHPPPVSAA